MIVMDEFPNDFFSGPLETPEDLNGPNKEFSREFRVRIFFGILNISKPIFKYFGSFKGWLFNWRSMYIIHET